MRSVKKGRGPSRRDAIMGVFGAVFGVFWTFLTIRMGALFMTPFGLVFIGIAIYQAVHNFKNAKSENRETLYDITEDEQESFDGVYEINHKDYEIERDDDSKYCPYCGNEVNAEYKYCNSCGKKLPE